MTFVILLPPDRAVSIPTGKVWIDADQVAESGYSETQTGNLTEAGTHGDQGPTKRKNPAFTD